MLINKFLKYLWSCGWAVVLCLAAGSQAQGNHLEVQMYVVTDWIAECSADRGRMTYLNPGRSFSFEKSDENKLSKDQAARIGRDTLIKLGVPDTELARQAEVRVLVAAGRDHENRQTAAKRCAELHVRYPRQVSGFPVFDSSAKLAIDALGDVVRMHLVWPEFNLVNGLSLKAQYPREKVIQTIARRLTPEDGCSQFSRVLAFVAYVDSSEAGFGEGRDERGNQAGSVRYVPSLVVYAVPPEPKEDSGEISMAGVQLTVPLFAGAVSEI